jgi:hypothetical protein
MIKVKAEYNSGNGLIDVYIKAPDLHCKHTIVPFKGYNIIEAEDEINYLITDKYTYFFENHWGGLGAYLMLYNLKEAEFIRELSSKMYKAVSKIIKQENI